MLIGSTQSVSHLTREVAPWLLALVAVVFAGALVIYTIRRMMTSKDPAGGGGFALEDLRALHRDGQLSDEEFERAKAVLIGRIRTAGGGKSADNGGSMQNESE
jgi:hypothetical protein